MSISLPAPFTEQDYKLVAKWLSKCSDNHSVQVIEAILEKMMIFRETALGALTKSLLDLDAWDNSTHKDVSQSESFTAYITILEQRIAALNNDKIWVPLKNMVKDLIASIQEK